MSYLEELLPEFRRGAKIRRKWWNKEDYIYQLDDFIYTQRGTLFRFEVEKLNANDWELYQEQESIDWELYQKQESIDWDYIIKNRCLCWFWDRGKDYKIVGILEKYFNLSNISRFIANIYGEETGFCYCRPVRRDEVTFYEDKEL